jgi:hypothetical protein
MSKLYKLTKGTVSVIRKDRAGVEEAKANGYALDGECDEQYNVIDARPEFLDETIRNAVKAEMPKRGRPAKASESDGE